ncbi:retrovirus-related pol polyprotein from transposon 17.6 [Tanacetum coccineum]
MAPKKTTTPKTDAAIKELIAQGVADALAEYEANRSSRNGDDSHDSKSGRRRTAHYSFDSMNSHVKIVGHDTVYGMTWKTLMKMMTNKYCPRSEIKKMEIEIWNLKVKGTDVVEKYVGGLPDMIQGSMMAYKPKTMQEAIEFANELMDQKIRTFAERQAENKRKLDNNSSDNNAQQPHFKRQNVARAYSAGPSEKKEYAGTLPLSPAATNNQRTLTCYECGNQGHYRSDCLELKNQNHGKQVGGTEARRMVYALGRG